MAMATIQERDTVRIDTLERELKVLTDKLNSMAMRGMASLILILINVIITILVFFGKQ